VKFSVKALRGVSDVVRVTVEAGDLAGARLAAAGQGLRVISIKVSNPVALRWTPARTGFALELFSQELVSLQDAGLSLVEAVDLLAEKEQGRGAGAVLAELRADLRVGLSFSDALARQGGVFPPLFVATARAAERTGDVREAIARFTAYRAQLDGVRRKVVAASVYPLTLAAVGLLVTAFMLLYVVPRFSRIYEEVGGSLPWMTRWLIAWGQVIEAHTTLVLAGTAAALGGLAFVVTRSSVRRWIGLQVWKVPAIGSRLRVYELARFYRTLGMLLKSGITLPTALDMAGGLLSPLLRQGLEIAARQIRQGQPVSRAFEEQGLTTPVSLRLLAVGERSGRMPHMVERIALFYEDDLARWIDWFTRLFEPLLMMFIGALVGLIVVLLYLPIFELAESVK
jgi:general secretion pathway protein F